MSWRARFAALFQASPAAISVTTLNDGRFVDVNAEFERQSGFSRDEVFLTARWSNWAYGPILLAAKLLHDLAPSRAVLNVEQHFRRKSGEIMRALSSFEVVELSGVPYILTLAIDITDRKRAEDQVRFQAGLLGAVGQAVIATDPQDRILYWNHMAEKMYGWTAEEALGRHSGFLTPANVDRGRAIEILNRVRAGETWSGEYVVQRRDGSTFPALVTDTPFYDAEGSWPASSACRPTTASANSASAKWKPSASSAPRCGWR